MDYITITGNIVKFGAIETQIENKSTSVTYDFIEFKDANNGEIIQTNTVVVSDNLNELLKEGLTGLFVFDRSRKITIMIGVKSTDQQTTILEHSSMVNIKGIKALKTMSSIGGLAAALGVSQLLADGEGTDGFLLAVFGILFAIVTGVQPMMLERVKKKHRNYLLKAGFDIPVTSK